MRARRLTLATALVTAVTAGGLLTACGPNSATGASSPAPVVSGSRPASAQASAQASASAPSGGPTTGSGGGGRTGGSGGTGGATAAPVSLNGTAGSMLTISDGTSRVVMNGTVVDFGVVVRDLAWSPDGRKAAFVDGDGNLDTANADGSGRIVVAHNPGGVTWSHPAWEVVTYQAQVGIPARDNLFFVSGSGATTRLMGVPATGGTPAPISVDGEPGAGGALPTAGNTWINGQGTTGETVYANSATGEVYIRDDYSRQQGSALTNGSEPAIVPGAADGGIVFVRSVGGHDHVFLERLTQANPVITDLTPGATTDCTEPAVSPDGRTVAVRTPNGVAVVPIDGSAAPRLVSTTPGLPAYR
ncbi:PD40 domain-containing protein [Streptacidiphilus jiangxiensis]|uniref:WD40-like Beta Propeller Repeat n=1 Tax=Streptacidiphilus jiangxiensis TaxID=235985 RepID=A0A1H7PPZ9_STRJI|nr:PD40 domain-containing protein [Streptacidiphilus jiangxiensis]SEL37842.1 WD40-like Beta Propeller Repeat [Streptacidiphilus jiangxiensis]